jgi:hypothetical protein
MLFREEVTRRGGRILRERTYGRRRLILRMRSGPWPASRGFPET